MNELIICHTGVLHFRYMCRLSDQDLRLAGLRNMTDLMMTSVKDPIESPLSFDQEILDLAFKYFTCTTLTIRISGITQINVRGLLTYHRYLTSWPLNYIYILCLFDIILIVRLMKLYCFQNQVGLYNELTQTNDNLAAEAEKYV